MRVGQDDYATRRGPFSGCWIDGSTEVSAELVSFTCFFCFACSSACAMAGAIRDTMSRRLRPFWTALSARSSRYSSPAMRTTATTAITYMRIRFPVAEQDNHIVRCRGEDYLNTSYSQQLNEPPGSCHAGAERRAAAAKLTIRGHHQAGRRGR